MSVFCRALGYQSEESDFGHKAPPTETDHGQLTSCHQFVCECPRDPEQLAGLGDRVDEAIVGRLQGTEGTHGRRVAR